MWIFAGGVLLFVGLMGILSPAYRAFLAGSGGPRARIGAVTGAGGAWWCRRGSCGGPGRRPRRAPLTPRRAFRTRKCSSNRHSRVQNAHLESRMHISTTRRPVAVLAARDDHDQERT